MGAPDEIEDVFPIENGDVIPAIAMLVYQRVCNKFVGPKTSVAGAK